MKRLATLFGLTAMMASFGMAQDAKPLGISLRLGQFVPQNSFARVAGSKWTGAGIDANLRSLGKSGNSRRSLGLSIDFADKVEFQTIPLCINLITSKDEFYWFGGVGAAYIEMPRIVGSVIEKDSSVEFAYQFGFGYCPQKGKSPLFVEAKYCGNGEDRLSGVMVSLGIRM